MIKIVLPQKNVMIRLLSITFYAAIAILFLAAYSQNKNTETLTSEAYQWKNVRIGGGGFVDGIVFHPTEKNLVYCRTDMGGAYRRNSETLEWEPLVDWISYTDRNLMGIESIALDPSDPDRLYLSCGTYTDEKTPNGAILRSSDRGKTFERTDVPFKMGGNENGRGNGERMAVDPNNSNILYLGTRQAGLWKSMDQAVTWNPVKSFPDVTENPPKNMKDADSLNFWKWTQKGSGIIFVIFDPKSASDGISKIIYTGVSIKGRDNLFVSKDAGKSWKPLPGQPTKNRPTHAALGSDGLLYITYGDTPGPSRMIDGSVWKFNTIDNSWTDITPDHPDPETRPFGYAAVSLDANDPQTLIVSSYHRYGIDSGDDIFRSTDGGKTWNQVFGGGGTFDDAKAPYTSYTGIHWLFDIEIDPFNPEHAIFTTGYGGHETFNLTDMDEGKPTTWQIMSTGIEETVPLDLLSPPQGAHLITAIGDYGGFVHWNLDAVTPGCYFLNPRFGNTNSLACAVNKPELIVRTGRATEENPNKTIGYSLDGGKTWQPTDTIPHPQANLGHIAVSANGESWLWTPDPVFNRLEWTRELLPVYVTSDQGSTWMACKGIPKNTRVIADKVNPDKFYGMDLFNGKLFISHDGGANFEEHTFSLPGGLPTAGGDRGDERGGQDRIYATPGQESDLWIAAFDGLYHSTDEGKTFIQTGNVDEIHGFGFGKAAPNSEYPALFLIGTVQGVRGIFRSDDKAVNWIRINDDQHEWGLLMHITGDPKKYGRAYIGTHGRGALYGDPVK